MLDPAVALVLRLTLGALFAVAAAHKLAGPTAFRTTLGAYALVPPALLTPVAVAVVMTEVAIVVGVTLGWPWAPPLAAALLALYALALAINLVRGRHEIDCGCGGVAGDRGLSWWLVARNLAVAAAALGLRGTPAPRPLVWIDGVTIAAAAVAVGLLYAAADHLLANAAAVARARGAA